MYVRKPPPPPPPPKVADNVKFGKDDSVGSKPSPQHALIVSLSKQIAAVEAVLKIAHGNHLQVQQCALAELQRLETDGATVSPVLQSYRHEIQQLDAEAAEVRAELAKRAK